ncbi:hypothetical protein L3Q82_003455 [Scortum barcoo]|uniref:Uncharacterized protein n=1 Tax=Scortum barcoo TaxID=214431 RepID=A0ACB8VM76_9TELE|nr:hypothetical protein L3Q82_003455 [Scortum barcoo]
MVISVITRDKGITVSVLARLFVKTNLQDRDLMFLEPRCLFTHDSIANQSSNTIIKFADDMTVIIGLITSNDERQPIEGRCTIESILTDCITAWYGSWTTLNLSKALQRVVRTAQHIIRAELPSLEDLYIQQ